MSARFKRAFSTLGCPELSLDAVLALAAHFEVDALELRTLEGTMDLPALFAGRGREAIGRILNAHAHIQILVLSTSFRLVRPTEADRAALLAFVPWAETLGVPWLRVFDGMEPISGETFHLAVETFRWWRRLREERGWKVDLLVETHDGLCTGETICRFCVEAEGVRLLWDAHKTWRATGVAPPELWPDISAHIGHIHVKDSVGRPSGGSPYTYTLPGAGEFPMGALKEVLQRDGFRQAISLEWERQWHPDLPPLEQALQAAIDKHWW